MRIKPALCMASVTLSLVFAAAGISFAQAGPSNAPEGGKAGATSTALNQLILAAVLPESGDRDEVQMIEPAVYNAEDASTQAPGQRPKATGQFAFSRIGIGVKFSTLGAGIEVGTPLAAKFNLRGGLNILRYSRLITNNGIHYDGHMRFQSAEAHLDWFPIGGFHISPGLLFYNGNQVTATAMVPGGQTFSLGGTTYESDPAAPVTSTGKLDFVKVSPSIMVGIGNLIPRNGRHYSFLFEVGGAYQGSARVALNFAGNVCDSTGTFCRSISSDPTVQSNIQSQQVKIQNDVNPYRFFPVISFGVGFNF